MKIFDFGKGIPDCVSCEGGNLSVTDLMVKQGTGSLRWDFSKGDKLIFSTDIGYKTLVPDGKDFRAYVFGVYIFGFGEEGSLQLDFLKKGIRCTGFNIEMDYRGWRSSTACFDRDMDGTPCEGMDSMVITAGYSGSILISELVTAGRVDRRHILKSYQVPFIKNNELLIKKNWQVAKKYSDVNPDLKTVELIK